jgi:hypothetical protein
MRLAHPLVFSSLLGLAAAAIACDRPPPDRRRAAAGVGAGPSEPLLATAAPGATLGTLLENLTWM